MSTLKNAKWVLNDLIKNGYEAYIVGGAVRDHVLRQPLNDIDITKNAKTHQVAKLFKTKPKGIKYGTDTVFMNHETYEVTTYRIDGEYLDSRHPEEVIFSEDVKEDVLRRDFTINGLLMNKEGEIIDHVGGLIDLNAKIIRTIGDPYERFQEDALRMLRAFYFQSKLGFQIDRKTRDAIEEMRFSIKDIAMERILNELIKILQGPHVKRAIQSIITTKVHKVLPGLEKGFEAVSQMEEIPYVDAFFILSFALNGSVPSEWKFSNKHRHRYELASKLVNEKPRYDEYTLYTYGLDMCLLVNRVSHLLGREKNLKTLIEKTYESLPIQSDLDLKLRASEILNLTHKKAGAWLKNLQQEMVLEVINHRLENNKQALEAYVLKRTKED